MPLRTPSVAMVLALAWIATASSCSSKPAASGGTAATTGGGGAAGGGGGGAGGAGGGDAGPALPPAICHKGTKWKAGTSIFKEATHDWGLDAVGALGVRFNAIDFDGDGWTDLVVRLGGTTPDDFSPGGARTTWLLRNTHDRHFEDVTVKSGIRQNRTVKDPTKGRPGEVFAFGDVNNDGFIDVYTGLTNSNLKPEQETSEILLNNGDGTFRLGPANSAIRLVPPIWDAPAGASFVDFDRDGNLDLWVVEANVGGAEQQSHLFKGDGKGGFVEVTAQQGLTTLSWFTATNQQLDDALGHANGWAAGACDLNGDGDAELLAASYGRAPNQLWQSTGKAGGFKFTNRSVPSGYAYDADQNWHDNESARCWCTLHPTDTGCAGVPPPKYIQCMTDADAFRWNNATDQNAWRLGGNNATTVCADLNNDGHLDLVTSDIMHWDVGESSDRAELLLNTGKPDVTLLRPGNATTGLARTYPTPFFNEGIMTLSVLDFDNDGWGDIYFGNSDYPYDHGLLYHQDSAGHFEAVPIAQAVDQHRSLGSVVADFDHDGDLDLIVGHSFARCHSDPMDDSECYPTQQVRFFENVMGQDGNFVALTLTGAAGTNRSAIHARVSVTAGGVTQTQEVDGGHGQYGYQDDLTLHFGLGEACEAQVTVRWPDAALTTEKFDLPAGYRFLVTQGQPPKVAPK